MEAAGGSEDPGKELAQESHLNSLVYPLHVMRGHWGPEWAATSPGSHNWQIARFQNLSSLPAFLPLLPGPVEGPEFSGLQG